MNKKSIALNFELNTLIRDLLKNIWVYVLAFLIGFMGSYVYSNSNYVPTYSSTAVLCINRSTGGATTYSNIRYSKQLTSVFAEVFVQDAMKSKAANYLGLYTFDGEISAYVIENTNFLQLSVKSQSPDLSYKMLHALLDTYPEITEKLLIDSVVTVLQQPNMPQHAGNRPSDSDNTKCGLIGVGIAVLLTVLLSVFRTTVKSEDSFKNLVDGKLIGTVTHENKKRSLSDIFNKKKSSLLIYNNYSVGLSFVESYQKIATKIEYMKRRDGDKVFLFTSVAENEGKSTSASNVAIALASRGNKVLLFDFDLKRPALYKIFDVNTEKLANNELSEMMAGKIDLSNYMFCRFRKSSLYMALNAKSSMKYHAWMEKGNVAKVLEYFKERVDYIIVDTAPISVDSSITNIIPLVDKTVLMVRTDVVYASAINDAILTIKDVGGDFAGCILNDVYPEFSLFGQSGYDETGYYSKRYMKNRHNVPYKHYGTYSESLGLFDDKTNENND